MRLTVTIVLTIVRITVAIAEMMVLMMPPMVETTEPWKRSLGENRRGNKSCWKSPLLIVIAEGMWDRRGFGRC